MVPRPLYFAIIGGESFALDTAQLGAKDKNDAPDLDKRPANPQVEIAKLREYRFDKIVPEKWQMGEYQSVTHKETVEGIEITVVDEVIEVTAPVLLEPESRVTKTFDGPEYLCVWDGVSPNVTTLVGTFPKDGIPFMGWPQTDIEPPPPPTI